MKTFFRKLEQRFLVETAKIENAIFPHKTANVKQKEWGVQNGPILS